LCGLCGVFTRLPTRRLNRASASDSDSLSSGEGLSVMPSFSPVFRDEQEAREIYASCGRLAMCWGYLELVIEGILLVLRNAQNAPVKDHAFIVFPVSFDNKRDEIKDRIKRDWLFHPAQARTVKLLGDASAVHNIRNIALHGLCQGTTLTGSVRFDVADNKRGLRGVKKVIAKQKFLALPARVDALHLEFEALHREMLMLWLAPGRPPYDPTNRRRTGSPTHG